jgi:hypothetical protein
MKAKKAKGEAAEKAWDAVFAAYARKYPELAEEWKQWIAGKVDAEKLKDDSFWKFSGKNTTRSTVRKAAVRKRTVRTVSKPKARTASTSKQSDLQTAESVLRSLKAKYRYLDGVTVTIGSTPGNYQAVSYYARGRIVISPKHTASISTILKHEIWHCIDYRDNGRIDWGERVAPKNAAEYLK